MSPGVNRGIFDAHAAGTVTSASLLANAPGLNDAITRLRHASTLQVGLHLNLTAGAPVAQPGDVTSLWDPRSGEFYLLPQLVRRALMGRVAPEHVAAECSAQLARLRTLGVSVGHIDAHRHVHALPGVWKPVVAVARRAGVRAIRVPRAALLHGRIRVSRALVAASLRVALRLAANSGAHDRDLGRADHFRGLDLLGAQDFQRRLLALLDQLQPGTTELMVHPGYVDQDLTAWDSYTTGRERELAALCSLEVRDRLARGDILLVP
ncbi:MAG: hypothetical protein AUH75_00575 [Gemmatimonadetes bacterium 13_1_40CM_4_65_7]|nr:MAG: hypothetical protein AUH75_00575 [Gemmatimonadetes bacterium 13_1_40CM_4_65_7]